MDELIKALKSLGWKKNQIDFFTDPENRKKDVTEEQILAAVKDTQIEVFKSTIAPDLIKVATEEGVLTYQKGEKARIAKAADLGLSRKETDEKTLDEVLELATEANKHAKSADKTVEDLQTSVNEWKTKFTEKSTDFDTLTADTESQIETAKKSAKTEIDSFHVKEVLTHVRDFDGEKPREWARESDKVAGDHYIRAQLAEKYDIQADGTILNKDGTKAVNFSGSGIYEHVSEAYNHKFDELNYGKKSNGDETGEDGKTRTTHKGLPPSDKQSDATRRLIARAEKKAEEAKNRY